MQREKGSKTHFDENIRKCVLFRHAQLDSQVEMMYCITLELSVITTIKGIDLFADS
jgi:hypothetical protein